MNDSLVIRTECNDDFDEIRRIVKEAFAGAEHSDGDEHNLIDRLRKTHDYIPPLSLVAEINGAIVGYIMFSRIYIGGREALALAPLAVLPLFQNCGIGRALIEAGHRKAKEMGFCCSVVLGSPQYYAHNGCLPSIRFGITPPFEVPSRFYMVYPMAEDLPRGEVRYSSAFLL